VGEDLFGRFLVERLQADGVDTAAVARAADEPTGVTFVAVDHTGERSFLHLSGANARFGRDTLDLDRLPPARHLHYASFFILPSLDGAPAAGLLAEARARGMTTSLDLCWDRSGEWMERLRPCLPHADLLTPNREEAEGLTGHPDPARAAEALLSAGARAVAIKLGEDGCYYADASGYLACPAFRVPTVDTTGAGDCFVAGFLYARGRGWDLPRTLRFANACGAMSVREMGAVTGVRPAAEVDAWIAGRDESGPEGADD
jgi:hypothetical protein